MSRYRGRTRVRYGEGRLVANNDSVDARIRVMMEEILEVRSYMVRGTIVEKPRWWGNGNVNNVISVRLPRRIGGRSRSEGRGVWVE